MMGSAWAGAAFAIVVACGAGAGDGPGGVPASSSSGSSGASVSSSGSSGASASSSSGADGSSSASSSSSSSSGDAGPDATSTSSSGSAGNAFTGAPPYVPTLGLSSLKAEHQAAFGTEDPAKHDCSDCHLFAAAGSVFTDATGTTPVAMAEVRLRTASTGKALSTYTDENGNFIVEQSTAFLAGLKFPFQVGVRTDAGTALMPITSNDGSCNTALCHGGAQGWVHTP
jgi:hypothetical protein